MLPENTIVQSDCVEWMNAQEPEQVDLVFADPPFNIGYAYDLYHDNKDYETYYAWTREWMAGCKRLLKPDGSFWIAIGMEYAADIRMLARELGLTLRNWVIWYYTFGQNTKQKFARGHAHVFYFVKDPKAFHFDDRAVRTFSDRQRVYQDLRANPAGRIPDDVWTEFPRVCGTFGEREGWHPCQMPESILTRIVRVSSAVGDLVFDPFGGSGTTLVAAKRNARRYLATELSENYVTNALERLEGVRPLREVITDAEPWSQDAVREMAMTYGEAGVSTDTLRGAGHLLEVFTTFFNSRMASAGVDRQYTPQEVWDQLEVLRTSVALPKIRVHADEPRTSIPRSLDGAPVPCRRRVRQAASRSL